jgi:cell division protein FtsB
MKFLDRIDDWLANEYMGKTERHILHILVYFMMFWFVFTFCFAIGSVVWWIVK